MSLKLLPNCSGRDRASCNTTCKAVCRLQLHQALGSSLPWHLQGVYLLILSPLSRELTYLFPGSGSIADDRTGVLPVGSLLTYRLCRSTMRKLRAGRGGARQLTLPVSGPLDHSKRHRMLPPLSCWKTSSWHRSCSRRRIGGRGILRATVDLQTLGHTRATQIHSHPSTSGTPQGILPKATTPHHKPTPPTSRATPLPKHPLPQRLHGGPTQLPIQDTRRWKPPLLLPL